MTPSVLYLSYTGLLEPLGRSQVLAYLKRLSKAHSITLVTFEKSSDLDDQPAMDAARQECRQYDIHWIPKRYHQRPRLLATLYDLFVLTSTTIRQTRRSDAGLVHCRGYVAALGAWLAGRITQVPFVFDMRALWIDEMILAGRLRSGSSLEKLLRRAERRLLRDAAAVVSLTEAAVTYLRKRDQALEKQQFVVIPTCVDIDRFRATGHERPPSDAPVLGSVGTIASGWVPLDSMAALYEGLLALRPDARLQVLTRDDPAQLYAELEARGLERDRVSVKACAPSEVPAAMQGMAAGIALFHGTGVGKLGSMPTRIAEFLAAGIPVIGNRGVGDVAELLRRYEVGVVVEDCGAEDVSRVMEELLALWNDAAIGERCRAAAVDYFSVERGVEAYAATWRQYLERGVTPPLSPDSVL